MDEIKREHIRLVQNVFLIWLDDNIDENNEACQHTIIQLRRVINAVNTFTDVDRCIDFLTDHSDEKAFMIISGSLCRDIVPVIHEIGQLHSIFIFCENTVWTGEWSKIKGVFAEITTICEALRKAVQQCEQSAIPIRFVNTNDGLSKKNLDELDSLFMYTQILKEILLTIEFDEKNVNEFLEYSRDVFAGDDENSFNINQLNSKYYDKKPIWWYTCKYFLYSTLNRALRLMDADVIIKMGCFVRDLHNHIAQLHKEQFDSCHSSESFRVYRGQGISKADFNQMMKTKGGLMSFNNFLSTSTNCNVSRCFAESNQTNPDLVGILFVMTIDPSKSTTPFASIQELSNFQDEAEVLFSMHTIFRIGEIKPMDDNLRLFQVDLTLTSDTDEDFCALTNRIREDIFPDSSGWYRLGLFLFQIGRANKFQQLYEVILDQTNNESEKGSIYNQIGLAKARQGEYEEAISFCQKALDTYKKVLPPNDPKLATFYDNIGAV
jgi:tetratricopeptide (TPR) repeat protein